ncbi:permuted papain-like amidase YaeF/Yiix C92 family enzyme [Balneicella halophila]|uniref:Permuted papain-like amidase YaeF/Yiix C92 family enzyme n=1 Tax=Balneicella halophila TaxID=1537566 RepID=A0A7L4UR06_BALHA|nr:permuted papain-like amidase YaeF/Yiix C92 family enzyme [Balneicella halophila]
MLVIVSANCLTAFSQNYVLKEGDLLFKDTRNNAISQAIKDVTPSASNFSFSHVGVLFFENNEWKVLEAVPEYGVRISTLPGFSSYAKGEEVIIVVGRLKTNYPFDLEKLIEYGKKQLGKPYDNPFSWNDEAFYCSELSYKMFSYAGQNHAFTPKPMTFKEEGKDHFHPTWIKYYNELQVAIPEGELGINPNAMATSKSIDLLFELP